MNLLNEASDFKFVTRNGNIINNQLNANYSAGNKIIYSVEVFKSNLCDYKDQILVTGDISVIGRNLPTKEAFKNCAPFIKYITKSGVATIHAAADLHLVPLKCLSNF